MKKELKFNLTVTSLVFGFVGSVVLCSLLSICSFFTTRVATMDSAKLKEPKGFPLKLNSGVKRDFFLYLMPWLIYNLINAILGPYETTLLFDWFQIPIIPILVLSNVMSCTGTLVGGFIADMYGRKKALGLGLTFYGISSAFSGIIFSGIQDSLLVFLLFALNGFSWGIFLVLYFFVVWEDLSSISGKHFCYIGLSFYPLTMSLAQFFPPNIQISSVNPALVKCVLIFSSNVFLVAAQELLSPGLKREFDLFVYLEQVKTFFKKRYGGGS